MVKKRRNNDQGATAVEFALVLPLFLTLIFGIIDFGFFFFVGHTLQYATREGMRLALVGGRLKDENNQDLSRLDSIHTEIEKQASLAVDKSKLTIDVFKINPDGTPIFRTDPDGTLKPDENPSAGDPGSYMRVRTRYTYRFLTPLIAAFFPDGAITIEAQGTYRNEQFDA